MSEQEQPKSAKTPPTFERLRERYRIPDEAKNPEVEMDGEVYRLRLPTWSGYQKAKERGPLLHQNAVGGKAMARFKELTPAIFERCALLAAFVTEPKLTETQWQELALENDWFIARLGDQLTERLGEVVIGEAQAIEEKRGHSETTGSAEPI